MSAKILTRREFIKSTAVTSITLASLSAWPELATVKEETVKSSKLLKINVAGYDLDHVKALIDGRIQIKGCETHFEIAGISNVNNHVFTGPKTREVTEIGLHPFMLAYANDGFRDYTLIPVFPLRTFRHKSIYIRKDRGISKPEDLRGRKVGTAGYAQSSLVWIRGLLQHEYNITPEDVQWVIASKDSAAKSSGGRTSAQEMMLPEGVSVAQGPEGKDESEMLTDGDVDALFLAAEPRAFVEGNPNVTRIFPDSRKVEREYFQKTGIFPIMHAVAIRKDIIDEHPWLPKAVFDGYSEAKQLVYDYLQEFAWFKTPLPWISQEYLETRKSMGDNYWPYGIEPNRKTLEALLQYSYEQGFTNRIVKIEELFHSSTLEYVET